MDGPVLDVQVLNLRVGHVLDDEEMIRLVGSTVASLSIPVRGTITRDNVSSCASDQDVVTGDWKLKMLVNGVPCKLDCHVKVVNEQMRGETCTDQ